ncbi:MAG: abortive infection family protein [Anaerolineaceae bacterium]|nr:abortive infection family protein [Anaerolineaceae bacterium]MDE0328582.1 abortive infection family protein [Anaerolineaceae bacterium]
MSSELISNYTLNEFRNAIAQNWHEAAILDSFEAEGIDIDIFFQPKRNYGECYTLIEQFYSTLDFTVDGDVIKIIRVFETFLYKTFPSENTVAGNQLRYALYRDGYEYCDGRILSLADRSPPLDWGSELARKFDLQQLDRQVRRISDSIDDDPDLAIGTAKELLETICKTILLEKGEGYDSREETFDLLKKVQKILSIMPEDIDNRAKGATAIKRLLNNLTGIVRGMSEVRNLYGSGHGREGRSSSLEPRHAKLAAGAAMTLAVFLYETHLETREEPTP